VRRRVILEAKGGLGNQMFQYAAAKSIAIDLGADLVIDDALGFVLDRQYERKFELDKLSIDYEPSNLLLSFPLYVNRLLAFFRKFVGLKRNKRNFRNFIFEKDMDYIDMSRFDLFRNTYWLSGYFQDPRYFESNREIILNELTPQPSTYLNFLGIADLASTNSLIAVGIRVYEESTNPENHARDKVIKSIEDYEGVINKLIYQIPNPIILVFTSREFDFLKLMKFPAKTIFVNPDRGFEDTISTMWLLSICQHHVFNNSTFYWWGAVLSQKNYSGFEQLIYCSDNFLNSAISYPDWKKF
jgi:hypothetical protein